jgi:hypothetical protein
VSEVVEEEVVCVSFLDCELLCGKDVPALRHVFIYILLIIISRQLTITSINLARKARIIKISPMKTGHSIELFFNSIQCNVDILLYSN